MKYKGANKHTVEELEAIIDDLSDQLNERRLKSNRNDKILENLFHFLKDIYYDCSKEMDDDDVTVATIRKALGANIAELFKNNNVHL